MIRYHRLCPVELIHGMFWFIVLLVEEFGIAFSSVVASSAANVNFRRTWCHGFALGYHQLPHSFAMNLLHVGLLSATVMIATFSSGTYVFVTNLLNLGWWLDYSLSLSLSDWSSCLRVTCLWRLETVLSIGQSLLKRRGDMRSFLYVQILSTGHDYWIPFFLCKLKDTFVSPCITVISMAELALNMNQVM